MIDIFPKALRFARLAAEGDAVLSRHPQIGIIERKEEAFRRKDVQERVGEPIRISASTAEFCIRAIDLLLNSPSRLDAADWDGNDRLLLEATATSLRDQLAQSNAMTS